MEPRKTYLDVLRITHNAESLVYNIHCICIFTEHMPYRSTLAQEFLQLNDLTIHPLTDTYTPQSASHVRIVSLITVLFDKNTYLLMIQRPLFCIHFTIHYRRFHLNKKNVTAHEHFCELLVHIHKEESACRLFWIF